MTGSVDISSSAEKTRSLAFWDNKSDLLQCCPEVDDLSHVLKIHVGELLPIISIEELILLLIHIIQFP